MSSTEYAPGAFNDPTPRGVPTGLMAALLDDPLGLPTPTPRLWWQVPVLPGDGGGDQVAYEIELARDPRGFDPDAPIETTGKVSSPESTAVPWPFHPLAARSVAYWRVRIHTGSGRRTEWSDPQRLVTGPDSAGDWAGATAVWAADAPADAPVDVPGPADTPAEPDVVDARGTGAGSAASGPARRADPRDSRHWALIRHEFDLPSGDIVAALAYVTAQSPDGAGQHVYRMWCNDEHVGVGPARSADRPRYQTHDVSHALRAGERNAIAFCCWTLVDRRLQALLDVHYADGRVHTVVSGPHWRARTGGAYLSATGDLRTSYYVAPNEAIDARHEPLGWKAPGYRGDDFRPVRTAPLIGNAIPTGTVAIGRREVTPASVTRTAPGRWIVDVGREIVGGLRLTVDAPQSAAGTGVRILLGEELKPGGKVRFKLRAQVMYHEDWTLRSGHQVLEHWGYRAFRWAELRTSPDLDLSEAVTVLEHAAPPPGLVGSFDSSDENLNRVWQLCAHTILANRQDLYMDTPTRERLAYESDLLIHARCEMALARSYDLGRYTTAYVLRRPQWPTEFKFMGITAAWENYLETGDPDALDADFDRHRELQGERWLDADGLIRKDPGTPPGPRDIVDWPPSQRDDYVFTDVNTVVNAWQYQAFVRLAEAAEVTDRTKEAEHYRRLAERLRTALNERFYDPAAGCYVDGEGTDHTSQHASMYAVALGVAPEGELRRIGDWLIADREHPVRVSASAALWLLEALFATGHADHAVEIMTSGRRESWLAMMDDWGATMTMEAWSPELKPNTSFSHPWAAGPVAVIARQLLGIRTLEPGAAIVEVAPQLNGLARASGVVPTVRGPVTIQAERDPGYGVTVGLPGNTHGILRWPTGGTDPRRFTVEVSAGPKVVRHAGDLLLVELRPGYTTVVREE